MCVCIGFQTSHCAPSRVHTPPLCTSASTIGLSRTRGPQVSYRADAPGRQPAGTHKKYTQARARYGTHKETNTARSHKNVSVHTQTTVPRTNDRRRTRAHAPPGASSLDSRPEAQSRQSPPTHTRQDETKTNIQITSQDEHANTTSLLLVLCTPAEAPRSSSTARGGSTAARSHLLGAPQSLFHPQRGYMLRTVTRTTPRRLSRGEHAVIHASIARADRSIT